MLQVVESEKNLCSFDRQNGVIKANEYSANHACSRKTTLQECRLQITRFGVLNYINKEITDMYSKTEIEKKIKTIIASIDASKTLPIDEIIMETNLYEDIHMDSIELMNLVVKIEEEFDIEFSDEDMDMDYIIVFGNLVQSVKRSLTELNN